MVPMTSPSARFLRRYARAFFKPAARYPADPRAVFILALSVFSGLTAIALGAAPDTLNALLPAWGVTAWAIMLTLGSAVTLVGMAFQTVVGILVEQIGSVAVGVATIFYAVLGFWILGWDALQVVGIVLAWGLACFVRWIQLQALIHAGEAQARSNQVSRSVDAIIEQMKSN
jgi:hypothetical protein